MFRRVFNIVIVPVRGARNPISVMSATSRIVNNQFDEDV